MGMLVTQSIDFVCGMESVFFGCFWFLVFGVFLLELGCFAFRKCKGEGFRGGF